MKHIGTFLLLFAAILLKAQDSTTIKLQQYKAMFTNGLISSQEYETLKHQVLGIPDNVPQQYISATTTNTNINKNDTILNADPEKMYNKGAKDAERNYTHDNGVLGGTFATTFLGSPFIGCIPAIICSSTSIPQDHLEYPDANIFRNPDYQRGYRSKAHRMKINAAWTGWGVGCGVDLILYTTIGLVLKAHH